MKKNAHVTLNFLVRSWVLFRRRQLNLGGPRQMVHLTYSMRQILYLSHPNIAQQIYTSVKSLLTGADPISSSFAASHSFLVRQWANSLTMIP